MSENAPIIKKRIGFLAATALGLSAFAITCVVSCTVVVVYVMHVCSDKTDGLFCLAERTVRALPDWQKSLPPALGDMLKDVRRPDYAGQLQVTTRVAAAETPGDAMRIAIEVENRGPSMVTLLSLRVTVVDGQGRVLYESNEWAASPFAADRQWRGPLMPGAHRRFNAGCGHWQTGVSVEGLKAEVEITDIRLWNESEAVASVEEPAA